MIIDLVLAYAAVALAASIPGLAIFSVVFVRTWRDVRTRGAS